MRNFKKTVSIGMIILLILSLLLSCSTKKELFKDRSVVSSSASTQKLERMDSIIRNQPILDQLRVPVGQSETGNQNFDDAVNKAVRQILSRLNTSKSSGSNSYDIRYDQEKDLLLIKAFIAATQDNKSLEKRQDSTASNKEINELQESETVRTVYPSWVYLVAGLVVVYVLIKIVSMSIPGIRSIRQILKSRNTEL